jgi:YHS domain-containing protein
MLARFLVWAFFLLVVWRAIRGLLAGIAQGASSPPPASRVPPEKGELMERDPVCGTFVVPSRAVSLTDRTGTHHFCSDTCRKKYGSR